MGRWLALVLWDTLNKSLYSFVIPALSFGGLPGDIKENLVQQEEPQRW